MDFLIILIDLVVIALGIVDVRFGFICRREQHQNKMNAQIYVQGNRMVPGLAKELDFPKEN